MKELVVGENWWAADIETTGLLEDFDNQEKPKVWVLGRKNLLTGESSVLVDYKDIQSFLNTSPTLVMHNGSTYDIPVLGYFGFNTTYITLIDSLFLSWYLEPDRTKHGLEGYGIDFGIAKPKIDDWENLTQEDYNHRVLEDCEIQYKLFYRQKAYLDHIYKDSGGLDRLLGLMRWKGEQQAIQQDMRWSFDVESCKTLIAELEQELEVKTNALFEAMPKIKKTAVRSRPAKPFLKNGELSAAGIKWQEYTSAAGLPFESVDSIEVVVGCDDPNPQSPNQIKDWLYAHGWIPTDFKYVREDDGSTRKIPQVNLSEGRVSQSVIDLAEKLPAVEYLAGLGVVKHRLGMCKGFLRDMHKGTLKASCQGLTNTLRLKHRELVNLPSGRALYGSKIRGLLKAREGYTLLGSDLSSLEDRIKHHFQWPLDRQYVEQQLDKEFDPHLLIAVMGGMMTQADSNWYKDVKAGRVQKDEVRFKVLDKVRSKSKQINYAAQYGAGVETMARAAGVTKAVATDLRDAYKKLNWSIDKIASLTVIQSNPKYGTWQYNPISKLWYSLRSDKDRFSTLVQGSGAYVLDMWLYIIHQECLKQGIEFRLLGQFHDELILEVKDEAKYERIVRESIAKLSKSLSLNRGLDCGVDFGKDYSEIH